MSDGLAGVSFNPFSGKVFTADEINHLDTNKDGKVSEQELQENLAWLSGQDDDCEIDLELDDKAYQNSKANGLKDKCSATELSGQMDILIDQILEELCQGIPKEDIPNLEKFVKGQKEDFIKKYLEANGNPSTISLDDVAQEFSIYIQGQIAKNKNVQTKSAAVETPSEEDTKKGVEGSYELLMEKVAAALENGRISDAELKDLKNNVVDYIASGLVNNIADGKLLSSINPNYSSDSNFQKIYQLMKDYNNETDPEKQKQILNEIKENLMAFLNKPQNSENLKTELTNRSNKAAEEALQKELNEYIDTYIENYLKNHPGMSEEEVKEFAQFVKANAASFKPSNLKSDGGDTKTQFDAYMQQKIENKKKIDNKIKQLGANPENIYNTLVQLADTADSDKYITADECKNIKDKTSDFIINQMLNGITNPALLQAIDPNYANNAKYKEALSLIQSLKTLDDPSKVDEIVQKAKTAIAEFLESKGSENVIKGINATKPIQISGNDLSKLMVDSSIYSDFLAGASRSSQYGKQNEESLKDIQEQAKKDLEAIAEALKAKLKAEYGAAFNESEIDSWIKSAMNDTIAAFTSNMDRRKGGSGGVYTVPDNENRFVFLRRSGTKSGRYTYNVKALANTFISKFNEVSKTKTKAGMNPALRTFDKEDVIENSLGNDYYTGKEVGVEGRYDDKNAYAKLIEQAKADLLKLSAAMKTSLLAEGVSLSDIDKILDDSVDETITKMKSGFKITGNQSNNGFYYNFGLKDGYCYNVKNLADTFMSIVDKKVKEAQNK